MSHSLRNADRENTRLFLKVFSRLPFPWVTLVDPLVEKLAEVEVESLGVNLVRVNAETLSEKPLDGEIAEA